MLEARGILHELGSKSKWLVLYILYKETGLTGRKIARRTGLSWAPVKRALDQLLEMHLIGFVQKEQEARRRLFHLNQEHFLYPALKAFFKEMEKLPQYLFEEMARQVLPERGLLLGLKVAPTYLVIVVKKKNQETEEKIRRFFAKKGLEPLGFKLVSGSEFLLDQELQKLPGPTRGLSLDEVRHLKS